MALSPHHSQISAEQNELLKQYGVLRSKYSPQSTGFQTALADFQTMKIEQMQKNLLDANRVASQRLSQSLVPGDMEVDDKGNIKITWEGEDYALYIDQGVNGWKKPGGFGSSYQFTNPPKTNSGGEFSRSIREWIKFRNITSVKYRDHKDRLRTKFLSSDEDYKQAVFVLKHSIRKYGIAPSYFIEHAFDNESEVMKEFETILLNEWEDLENQ